MEKNYFLDLFTNWNEFLTPSLIKIINFVFFAFYFLLGVIILLVLGSEDSTIILIIGIVTIIISPFFARITSEVILVLFRIHNELMKINSKEQFTEKIN